MKEKNLPQNKPPSYSSTYYSPTVSNGRTCREKGGKFYLISCFVPAFYEFELLITKLVKQ